MARDVKLATRLCLVLRLSTYVAVFLLSLCLSGVHRDRWTVLKLQNTSVIIYFTEWDFNTLRTGSFKLLKTPLLGFLTILTL